MSNSNPTLRKAHSLLRRISKKLKREDIYFSAQIGVDSTKEADELMYVAMINSPREGLAPVTFADHDKVKFIEKIKSFYEDKINENEVEIAYLEAQLVSNERSSERIKKKIAELNGEVIETKEEE